MSTNPNAVGSAPVGPAGGVLSGTYPNPGLASPLTVPGNLNVTGTLTGAAGGTVNVGIGGINNAGFFDVTAAGKGLAVNEGANGKQGTATLAAGTVTVANTSVTATSRIICGLVTLGTVTVPSALGVSARVAGTSFTILASQATDTSVVWYEIFEPG